MTSTEITQQDGDSGITLLPPAKPMASSAVDQLMQHAEAMQTAHRLATVMCGTQMVPAIYRGKPDDGAAAILYGAELGLNPIQSLQNIFPVHGMPSMYARTMAALVKRHGYRLTVLHMSDDEVSVEGVAPDGQTETSTWTIERATKAGYVPTIDERTKKYKTNANGKMVGNEKYLTQPREMLYAKAVTEVCRHLAPDVLLGIAYSYEELQDEQGDDDRPRRRVDVTVGARAQDDLRAALGSAPASPQEPDQAQTDTAPEPDPELEQPVTEVSGGVEAITDAQIKKLNFLLTKEGFGSDAKGRAEKIDWLRNNLHRDDIQSSKDLTKSEGSDLIDFLERAQAADAAKNAGQQTIDGQEG